MGQAWFGDRSRAALGQFGHVHIRHNGRLAYILGESKLVGRHSSVLGPVLFLLLQNVLIDLMV